MEVPLGECEEKNQQCPQQTGKVCTRTCFVRTLNIWNKSHLSFYWHVWDSYLPPGGLEVADSILGLQVDISTGYAQQIGSHAIVGSVEDVILILGLCFFINIAGTEHRSNHIINPVFWGGLCKFPVSEMHFKF